MLHIHHAKDRGTTNLAWLDSRHTFSFNRYYDRGKMGYRNIRVINDDVVAPGKGFNTHPHKDMEIISYVVEGALKHKDSMGNGSVIKTGDVQRITAGTGILHSEFNASDTKPVRFLQIWITPAEKNLQPEYEQVNISSRQNENMLNLIASGKKADSLKINQDVEIFNSKLSADQELTYVIGKTRYGWIQMIDGFIEVNTHKLKTGDGLAISNTDEIKIHSIESSEFLLFDLN